MDLGDCTKIHDLALRADYEIASKERDLFFELDVSVDIFLTSSLKVSPHRMKEQYAKTSQLLFQLKLFIRRLSLKWCFNVLTSFCTSA